MNRIAPIAREAATLRLAQDHDAYQRACEECSVHVEAIRNLIDTACEALPPLVQQVTEAANDDDAMSVIYAVLREVNTCTLVRDWADDVIITVAEGEI